MKKSAWEENKGTIIFASATILAMVAGICGSLFYSNVPGIAIGTTSVAAYALILGYLFAFHERRQKEFSSLLEQMKGTFDGLHHVRTFSGPQEALEYFETRIPEMTTILNTSVCTAAQKEIVKKQYIEQPWYRDYISKIVYALRAGKVKYKDILSPSIVEITGHRYHIFEQQNLSPSYEPRVCQGDVKFTEFTIIYYKSGPPEVLFGWDHAAEKGSIVILSTHPAIVAYFDQLFDQLWDSSSKISQAPPIVE